jgi:hypothetical protein
LLRLNRQLKATSPATASEPAETGAGPRQALHRGKERERKDARKPAAIAGAPLAQPAAVMDCAERARPAGTGRHFGGERAGHHLRDAIRC